MKMLNDKELEFVAGGHISIVSPGEGIPNDALIQKWLQQKMLQPLFNALANLKVCHSEPMCALDAERPAGAPAKRKSVRSEDGCLTGLYSAVSPAQAGHG